MTRILVTGATGQLARCLDEAHADRSGDAWTLVALGRPQLDVTKPDTLAASIDVHEPDVVINCAAYTAVDAAESHAQQAMAVNADGACSLAKLCARHDVPLVHISTDYVFDGTKTEPYRESDWVNPTCVYGLSKLRGEEAVAETCTRYAIVRTGWVYSPFGQNFVKTMLRLAADRDEISVVDDQLGCPTYARHLADAILKMAGRISTGTAKDTTLWGTYHAVGNGETSWFGFAEEIFRQSTKYGGPNARVLPISTKEYPTAAKRPLNSRLDCTFLTKRFGIMMPDWRSGTQACIARLLSPTPSIFASEAETGGSQ